MATKRRLTIEIPATAEAKLEKLRTRLEATTTIEVIRRALILASFLSDAQEAGKSIVLKDQNGNLEPVHLLY